MQNWSWSIVWTPSLKELSSAWCRRRRAGKTSPIYRVGRRLAGPYFPRHSRLTGRQSFSRHSVPLLWCSLYMSSRWVCIPESFASGTYIPISQLRFTSWMKSTRLSTSEMFRLLRTISKTEPRTRSLSSFLWGMAQAHRLWKSILNKAILEMICSNLQIGWSASTRHRMQLKVRSVLPSVLTHPNFTTTGIAIDNHALTAIPVPNIRVS